MNLCREYFRRFPRWGLRAALLGAALLPSCIQPDSNLDDFSTRGQSSVTGDDDLRRAKPDASAASQGEPADSADTTDTADTDEGAPVQGSTKPVDAGTTASDGGKPRPVEVTPTAVVDAGRTAPTQSDAGMVAPSGPVPTKLTFSVLTATPRGRYSPRNIYAIWVVDGQGKFVKTLAKFAAIRARYLTGWNAASGNNVVDAVTGATMSAHGQRSATWNLTDVSKKTVPDGDYKIVVELTDADRTGVSTSVPFTKGSAPMRLMPPDQPNFLNMSLVLE